jgi:hypothetical protein
VGEAIAEEMFAMHGPRRGSRDEVADRALGAS